MELRFHVVDYLVMGAMLMVSLGIGLYFGLIKKQQTPEEYLLGNREMGLLPVALSMIVTYQSAISVIGAPTELYLYHTMSLYGFIGYTVCNLVQFAVVVPLVYPLRLSSAYEVSRKLKYVFGLETRSNALTESYPLPFRIAKAYIF